MSANSHKDQNKDEFKDYLDKTGVLEFLSQNQENKKFKEFLESLNKARVPEFLDLVLSKLYKEPHKPSDAREYIKKNIGGAKAEKDDIAKLSYENDELKKRIEELEKRQAELKEKLVGAADAPTNNEVSATAVHEPPNIDSLPVELMETILSVLSPRDLKSVVLVSKRWNTIGEGPHLWSGFNLVVSNLADMPEILGLSRLSKLKQLTLMDISKEMLEAIDYHEVFESIENHEGLQTLKLLRCNLSEMIPDLFARVLRKMEKIRLEETDLNRDQWNSFNSMSDDTNLKKLEIIGRYPSLTEANPQSLAEAVSKLEMFELDGFRLTSEQSKAMFKQLAIKSKLKSLKMRLVDLSSVDEPILVTALNQLEEAALCLTSLNARQCTAIIGLVAAGNSKLKVLRLPGNDLEHVNPPDMAKAVGNLEIVDLYGTELTNEQCQEIFKYARGDSNLKVLNIGRNDLRSVEPASLAKTVSKMEKCSLRCSKLTRPQLKAIFKQLNEDCKLKELDLSIVSLFGVEEDVLSKAVANLVEVDLDLTQLTTRQLEALFMEIKAGRKMKILKLRRTDLRSVKIDSLVGALGYLEVVHLSRGLLTPEQRDAVKSDDCRAKAFM